MGPAAVAGGSSADASSRSSPAAGTPSGANASSRPKRKAVNSNGYHPPNPHAPLSSMSSTALDLTTVELRGQPTAVREPLKKKSRPHGISDAPTYCPTEDEWRDPLEYMKKIGPEASQYGICKIIPPDSWNPEFAIDTEKFHFRTRRQELNSVEGSTRANLTYLDGLAKFHKQQGNNLHRLPYVDKKPLDLYRLKKAVESRGGFDKVCKLKKWAEIGRDLGYSGKIMSSLSTSLKNSYQKWLCPYEEYLRLAKPGVHLQLENEYGGPLTPSPAPTPAKRSNVNTPMSVNEDSPAQQASDALQANVNGIKNEADRDTPMTDAPPASSETPASGFTPVNSGGFTAVNSGFTSVNKLLNGDTKTLTPDSKRVDSPGSPGKDAPESRSNSLAASAAFKRQLSGEESSESSKKKADGDMDECDDGSNRRSKRLKKESVPTVAGSHMTLFRPSQPKIPRDEESNTEKCETCARGEDAGSLLICESCDHAYHGPCLDPPLKRKPDAEWNCPRCLVGDGQFGFEEGGLYSLKQFQQKANDFKQGYFEKKMPYDHELQCPRPVTEEDVEKEFWRLVADLEETVEVEYGADIHCTTHGSGFPTVEKHPDDPYATDPWNLNVLPFHESLFRHIKSDISGMTVPWVYVGMIFSTFCWHNEDHYAYSANYQHLGATKTWYGIPGEDAEKFEAAMREAVPELFETQPDLLFQLVTLLTPEQLKKAGVRVYAIDQRAGQLVVTFPQAYHAGFNHGFNFNEAVNFAPPDWEPFGQAGVERLQLFRRQPCFSHDELLFTAAEGTASTGLSIQTAKWLEPALDRIHKREISQRGDFLAKHVEASSHQCPIASGTESTCSLNFAIDDEDVQDEDEQCCSYCKAFAYLSRFKCHQSGKVLCIYHAGYHACCEASEAQRFAGTGHSLIYRKTAEVMSTTYEKVLEKSNTPDAWEAKYEQLLEDEAVPALKTLRTLLHEGDRIPYPLPSLPLLREFVERCNAWVDDAMTYIVRKQQNRRKNDKVWQNGLRKSTGGSAQDPKDRDARTIDNVQRLLKEAERIGFDCPEIPQLQERAEAIQEFQTRAARALENTSTTSAEAIEELLEDGRGFNVDTPEEDNLIRILEQKRWNDRAVANRGVCMSAQDVQELVAEGERLQIPPYNDLLSFYKDQMEAGLAWERKAQELTAAYYINFQQLEALVQQVTSHAIPVSSETFTKVEQILHKHRDANRQIALLYEQSQNKVFRNRPMYADVVPVVKKLEHYIKPFGGPDFGGEMKRHEDWIRKGKKLFGKSNAPLHILNTHLSAVFARNEDCYDIDHDLPRQPGEPASRDNSPEAEDQGLPRERSKHRNQEVFCICRKVEAGMMIECEVCHEWYHYKCLKLARGKVKEDDKFTCPVCDWRVTIPRDAARPELRELQAWADEISTLPFQPAEEDMLTQVMDTAQNFRDYLKPLCTDFTTIFDLEIRRFYLRKLEGADVLLAFETNFLRQKVHEAHQIAPKTPPLMAMSWSTRKPRPTKLQKMLAEYGVQDPDDLPEHARAKANSLRRKAANAEAAKAAAVANSSNNAMQAFRPLSRPAKTTSDKDATQGQTANPHSESGVSRKDSKDSSSNLDPSLLGKSGPELFVDSSSMSLEDRLLQGREDGINLTSESEKSKALEILSRTESGRKQAAKIWGADVWGRAQGSMSSGRENSVVRDEGADLSRADDQGQVDQMFKEMTHQDDDDGPKRKDATAECPVTADTLESERNGVDALLDGE